MAFKNYVFVEVDGNSVTDTHAVGPDNVQVIVIDYDTLETDSGAARDMISDLEEIETAEGNPFIVNAIQRLRDGLEDEEDDLDAEDDDDDFDDDDEIDGMLDDCEDFDDEDEDDDIYDDDDDDEDEADEPSFTIPHITVPFIDVEDDEKKDEDYTGNDFAEALPTVADYNANELIPGAAPSPLDPRD